MMDRAIVEFKFESSTSEGAFEGYGSVFGNMDSHEDVVHKGAFAASLNKWTQKGSMPKMLLQHGGGFLGSATDALPIGVWTEMKEDDTGLLCKGQLFALGTEKGQYLYEGMKSGVLNGLSIGFRPVDFIRGSKKGEPNRILKAVDLVEVSVVTFPSNGRSIVSDVKTLDEVKTLADCERLARDAFGLSRKEATAFVSTIRRVAQRDAVTPNPLLSALKQARKSFDV